MLVVIGKEWVVDADGRRRLEEPDDYVTMEVASALRRNIRVIPVLVEGARMPTAADLPEALAPLTRRHAFELSDGRSRIDREELLRRLDRIVGAPAAANASANGGVHAQPQPEPQAAAPAPAVPAPASSTRDRTKGLVKWGWILVGGSLLVPFTAIVSIILGALVISRSAGERTGTGIGLIVGALLVGLFSLSFWVGMGAY
jgi:hypothetical protein